MVCCFFTLFWLRNYPWKLQFIRKSVSLGYYNFFTAVICCSQNVLVKKGCISYHIYLLLMISEYCHTIFQAMKAMHHCQDVHMKKTISTKVHHFTVKDLEVLGIVVIIVVTDLENV